MTVSSSARRVAGFCCVAVSAGSLLAASPGPASAASPPAASAPAVPPRVSVVSTASDDARLEPARRVLRRSGPVTVSVIGDSVGNDPGEWVSMWAGDLASDRYVYVHHFDADRRAWRPQVEVVPPEGDARREPLTVWNFGWPGGTPDRALKALGTGVPERPDLVIVSFGHNLSPAAVRPQYAALRSGLTRRFGAVPTVTTLAHLTPEPRAGQAEGRVVLLRWLREQRLPFVDERHLFEGPGGPDFMFDAVHPSLRGFRLISEVVNAALGPVPAGGRPTAGPSCASPSPAKAAVRPGRLTASPYGNRSVRVSGVLRAVDTCGRPLRGAWVRLVVTPQSGARTPRVTSSQTDGSGRGPVQVFLPRGVSGTLTGEVTDGTTTVRLPAMHLAGRR